MDWSDIRWDDSLEMLDPVRLVPERAARVSSLVEIAGLLCAPDTLQPFAVATDGMPAIPRIEDGRPLLFPVVINDRIRDGILHVGIEDAADALLQYAYLGVVRNSGWHHNSATHDPWFHRHVHRAVNLLRTASGTVLDIGCDDPAVSRMLFPAGVSYVGLEPGLGRRRELCLAGMAEFLPIRSDSVDGVALMTSLDHVLDYHAALDEAFRVLRPGGKLFLATLVWTDSARLTTDHIHFHHFRDFEIRGALGRFELQDGVRYNWKDDRHRHGVYLTAVKPLR